MIVLAANFPAMLLPEDEPTFTGQEYLACDAAAMVGALVIAGIDRRRSREEAEPRGPTHMPRSPS